MKRLFSILILVLSTAVLLNACSGGGSSSDPGTNSCGLNKTGVLVHTYPSGVVADTFILVRDGTNVTMTFGTSGWIDTLTGTIDDKNVMQLSGTMHVGWDISNIVLKDVAFAADCATASGTSTVGGTDMGSIQLGLVYGLDKANFNLNGARMVTETESGTGNQNISTQNFDYNEIDNRFIFVNGVIQGLMIGNKIALFQVDSANNVLTARSGTVSGDAATWTVEDGEYIGFNLLNITTSKGSRGTWTAKILTIPDIIGSWKSTLVDAVLGTLKGTANITREPNAGATSGTSMIAGTGTLTIPPPSFFEGTYNSTIGGSVGVYNGLTNNMTIVTTTDMSGKIGVCGTVTSTITAKGDGVSISGSYVSVDSNNSCNGSGTITMTR